MAAAQAAVVRLEKALGALDDADMVAKQALQSALERARARATERPLKERIKEAEVFVGECRRQHSPSRGSIEGSPDTASSPSRRARG